MKVLVTAASKHGATYEMAQWIGETIRASGALVEVARPEEISSIHDVDVVVLGSAVYAGHWLAQATTFAQVFRDELRTRTVFLFSSGPVGDPAKPDTEAVDVDPIRASTDAVEHRTFPGRIDRSSLGFGEKALVTALRVPAGDFRRRDDIESWAREIAAAARTSEAKGTRGEIAVASGG